MLIPVNRNYCYRLYPNKAQHVALERVLETHRQLYNAALQERREAWRRCRISIDYYDQANQLKAIREFDEDAAWLNYSSIQQTLRRLDKAFAAFFRRMKAGEQPGFPRFKSRKCFTTVEYRYGDGVRLVRREGKTRLHVQNVGDLKVKWHRAIPAAANLKCAYLKCENGKWYVIVSLELSDPTPAPHAGPKTGIDIGLSSLVTLSNGQTIDNPRWYRAAENKLAQAQRVVSRRVKFSNRWRKQARLVARRHTKIANQRRDFHHKLARQLVNTYSLIAVEDLNMNGLARSSLAKSVHDAGWSQLVMFLTYKAGEAGSQVVAVSPRQTSQVCSECDGLVPKDLSVRVHVCPECGLTLNRDVNAARNILKRALATTAWTEPSVIKSDMSRAFPRSRLL